MTLPTVPSRNVLVRSSLAAVLAVGLASCEKPSPKPEPAAPEPAQETVDTTPSATATVKPSSAAKAAPIAQPIKRVPVSTKPAPAQIWKEFDGNRAFADVRKQVEIGPRPSGSVEIEAARKHIITSLEACGWEVERQELTDQTPRGQIKFANIIARFSADGIRPVPQNTQRAIVCSHYDTKRFSTIRFSGANDGASSTGALLELARVLALKPALAAKIELVFFDGEEAVVQFSDTDGLYGSRYYAKSLTANSRNRQFSFGILWDMIGDSDLTITLPPDSPAELTNGILASASETGIRQHFSYLGRALLDDHEPLNRVARIPTTNLIDFDYVWWHTADDTIERLSPMSLQKVGTVTLHYLDKQLK